MRTLERVGNILIVAAIVVASVIVLQKSFHFIGTTPVLAVDDSIPNVAVSLAEHGRYGFLASPTQGPHEVDRTHAFYNYGPAYFLLAAGLSWLMGPSLTLFRMLHPIGLVAIVALSFVPLRRVSMVGPAVLALGLFERYFNAHSPIARPDIIVSVSVALMFLCAARAIAGASTAAWFGTGFFAATAVTSHQVAVAMVPAAGVVWLWTVLARRREWAGEFRRRATTSFAAVVAGGAAGALVYLVAIDFRINDLLELGTTGVQSRAQPYWRTVGAYFNVAWTSLPGTSLLALEVAFGLAALVALGGALMRRPERRLRVLALVMPPVVSAVLYQISVGFWGSVANGYVILLQVTAWWAVAALAAIIVGWARESDWLGGRVTALAAAAACALWLASTSATWLVTASALERQARGSVDFNDYVSEVVSPMPERAAVWGSLHFGVDAGDRLDLVQFLQVFNPALDTKLADRRHIVPDFLVLSGYEFADALAWTLTNQDNPFRNFAAIFPDARYREMKLVSAPPYGTTVVYQRLENPSDEWAAPAVAANDGSGRQWHSRVSDPIAVSFTPADDVTIRMSHYAFRAQQSALAARSAVLPAGFYLIDVEIERDADEETGFILAATARHFNWNDGDSGLPVAPYFVRDRRVRLLVDHWGGPLFLSRYEKRLPGAHRFGFDVRSVRRVIQQTNPAPIAPADPFPRVDQWAKAPGVEALATPEGEVLASSPSGGWVRLTSPPIETASHHRIMITAPVSGDHTVTVGILGERDTWIVEPVVARRRVVFDTGTATQFRIALDSAGSFTAHDVPQVTPLSSDELYVDRLVACRSRYLPRTPDCKTAP